MRIITEKHGCCRGEGQGPLKACSHSQEQEEVEPKFSNGRGGGRRVSSAEKMSLVMRKREAQYALDL